MYGILNEGVIERLAIEAILEGGVKHGLKCAIKALRCRAYQHHAPLVNCPLCDYGVLYV